MKDLSQRIAALSPEKRALFEQLKQQARSSAIARRTSDVAIPLSFAQERLWFLQQLDPTQAAYNIAIVWHFTGHLNITALTESLNALIQRHEVLRTAIDLQSDQPVQKILPDLKIDLPIIDLQAIPPTARQEELQKLSRLEACRAFDLTQAPLFRATLIQLKQERFALLLTLHHSIADGWSRGILLQEFAQIYRAIVTQTPVNLSKLSIQYADYALWQRQTQDMQAQQKYWQQQLADLPVLELPIDYARPSVPSYQGATVSTTFSQSLLDGLKQRSREAGVTVFMMLLSAFNVLLYRYSQQEDIGVGIPVANRTPSQVEPLIGFFVNTLVLRSRLSGELRFSDLLQQVKQTTADAFEHQDFPFAKLVDLLQPERRLSHNPLFQVMFQFQNEAYQLQNAIAPELALPDLELQQSWLESGFTKFDLTWHLIERSDSLLAVVEYSTDLFSQTTIERSLEHFQVLLSSIAADPTQRLADLPMLSESEQHQILVNWGRGEQTKPFEQWIHQRFEAQVERTPDAIAVEFQDELLSYQILNDRANQLAHYLRSRGVGLEQFVGIYLDRSPVLMTALLGGLKAGGAYVPLDLKLSVDRLSFMLSDAQPRILLTTEALAKRLPDCSAEIICLDRDWELIDQCPATTPESHVIGENLAYLIYTSGSTGVPKGTLLTHQGLINYLNWCTQAYAIDQGTGAPVQSSISFDATITSLYAPLMVGARVRLLSESEELETLGTVFQTQPEFSLIKLTPAHLEILSQMIRVTSHPKALILGGEAVTEPQLTFWRTHTPEMRLINEYGPTETVVGCCVYEATTPGETVPIGKAIANTQLYVLDRNLEPVPAGVAGELYIGGAGVARGYLNRPELTAERFIPNPFGRDSSRLYRTGDRVRWRSDGNLEYLGRLDTQVKIRGFRVELGEIETVLSQHPEITQAVVLSRSHPARLVAYLVGRSTVSDLRSYLAAKLPDYMIPSHFVWLGALPLTANGKIDRQALPEPTIAPIVSERPHTEVEAKLIEIWSDLLGVPVGVNSNFFELGGDSIRSLQAIAKANQAGFKLTPKQLFQHQTIAELATVATSIISSERTISPDPFPLTPIQNWLVTQNLQKLDHYNQAILLEVEPNLAPDLLTQAMQHLLTHHDALRLSIVQTESGWQQKYQAVSQPMKVAVIDLSDLDQTVRPTAIAQTANELQASLSLTEGSLVQSALFRMGEISDRLLMVIHHWAIDAVSWRILLEDLEIAYQHIQQGQQVQLPSKTDSFQLWAQSLEQYADSSTVTQELEYWQSLERCEPLPIDFSQGINSVASEAEVSISLDEAQTHALIDIVPQTYHTQITDLLLTAFVESMTSWTRSRKILIDLEHHGREDLFDHLNITRTVGWFTAIHPLCLNLEGIEAPSEKIKTIKEQLRQVPHQGIHYGLLRYLNREYSQIQQLPQPEISFNYLGRLENREMPAFCRGFAPESYGQLQHDQNSRFYILKINAFISNQCLELRWQYSYNLHRHSTIVKVANQYLTALRNLIAHCQSSQTGSYTPSDFAGANLSQSQLDQFLSKIQSSGKR
jgi:amino acid adenylation domain-containing protein/non-ribosomal peptide synthase protein (TIGR01720 family)